MRARNRGDYEELPPQNWEWPKDTWFQGRLNYIRQQQRSRSQKPDRAREPRVPVTNVKAAEDECCEDQVWAYQRQYFIRSNRYQYLFEAIGKTAVIALGFLIISPIPYLIFVHYQKSNDIPVSKDAELRSVLDPIPRRDTTTFPQPATVVAADLQAKPLTAVNVDSTTDVSERTEKSRQPIAQPNAREMIVAAKPSPTGTKEASREASYYKTIRIAPIRQEPRFAADITEHVDRGTVVTVFEIEGDWLKIKIGGAESVGYVRKEYVVPVS